MDTRDLIERAEEIETELAEIVTAEGTDDTGEAIELRVELAEINAIADAGIADWQYGATLIREDYFTDYARELAKDIGAASSKTQWPARCIDWEKAADELRTDYTTVEYQGSTYYVVHGHEYTPKNTLWRGAGRRCMGV